MDSRELPLFLRHSQIIICLWNWEGTSLSREVSISKRVIIWLACDGVGVERWPKWVIEGGQEGKCYIKSRCEMNSIGVDLHTRCGFTHSSLWIYTLGVDLHTHPCGLIYTWCWITYSVWIYTLAVELHTHPCGFTHRGVCKSTRPVFPTCGKHQCGFTDRDFMLSVGTRSYILRNPVRYPSDRFITTKMSGWARMAENRG